MNKQSYVICYFFFLYISKLHDILKLDFICDYQKKKKPQYTNPNNAFVTCGKHHKENVYDLIFYKPWTLLI